MYEAQGSAEVKLGHPSKATALHESISRIKNVSLHAQSILSAIQTGTKEDIPILESEVTPSLADLLNNGPTEIDKMCEEINQVLDKIRESLF